MDGQWRLNGLLGLIVGDTLRDVWGHGGGEGEYLSYPSDHLRACKKLQPHVLYR